MSLLQMSLAGAALVLLVVPVRAIAVNALPKRTFLILWWVVLLRLLVPVALPGLRARAPAEDVEPPALGGIGGVIRETKDFFAGVENAVTGTARPSDTAPAPAEGEPRRNGAGGPSVFALLWAAGALTVAGAFVFLYLRCVREFRTSVPVENAFPDGWLRKHRLRRRVEIRVLPGLSTPLTYGLMRPVILVPADMDWKDTRTAEYVLYHEFVHIRRLDTLTKLLAALALCLHWFNPLTWVFYALFNRDLELACDECVLRHFGRDRRASYAMTLISLEERRVSPAPLRSYFAKNAMEERIKAIMKTKRTTVFTAVMAALVVTLAVTAAAVFSPEKDNDGAIEAGKSEGPAFSGGADLETPEDPVNLDAYILKEIVKAYPAEYDSVERFVKLRIEVGELVYKSGETAAFIVPEMPVKVRVSSDGGGTWRESVLEGSDRQPEGYPPIAFYPGGYIGFNGAFGWAVLTSGVAGGHQWIRAFLTDDGGETWHEAGVPRDHDEVTTGAGYASDKVGFISYRYASDHGPDVWRTTDGGETWSRLELDLPEGSDRFYTPLSPVFDGQEGVYPVLAQTHDPDTGEVTASDSVLYLRSHDGGLTWALEDAEPTAKKVGTFPIAAKSSV